MILQSYFIGLSGKPGSSFVYREAAQVGRDAPESKKKIQKGVDCNAASSFIMLFAGEVRRNADDDGA